MNPDLATASSTLIYRNRIYMLRTGLTLEEPLTAAERKKLHNIMNDPKALDDVIDRALKGWSGRRIWKKTTKSS